jgi:hypothetical protein
MWENAGRPAARWLAPPMYSADLAAAVTAWERVGARYERACTLALIPSRRAEAAAELAELAELAIPMPSDAKPCRASRVRGARSRRRR